MASTVNQGTAAFSTQSLMVGTWTVRDCKSRDATFRLCGLRHENPLLRQFSSLGGLGRFRFRPDFPVFCKPLISAEQVRGSRLPWFCPGSGSGGGSRAGRRSGGRTSSGGGYCCWWRGSVGEVGEGRGFSRRIEAGFPPPICKAPGNKGAGVLLQDGPPACPPHTPCRPGPRRRRSHLLHYRVVLNWTAPRASRSARARAGRAARQEGGAGQSPPSPRGQRGQGRAEAALPLFTPLPDPKMCALLGSQSLEEGVARDSSLPSPPHPPLSLPFPPLPSPLVFLPAQPLSHSISTCPELQMQPSHRNQMGTKLQPAVSLPGSSENVTWMGNYKHGLYVFFKPAF